MTDHSKSFAHAIWIWEKFGKVEGRRDIAWVLRSDRELTPRDREWLADYIEGKISLPAGKPPHVHLLKGNKNLAIEAAAGEVERLVEEWVAAGEKRRGLKPRAIKSAVEKYCPPDREPSDFESSLITFVNRSKAER
jgi:hypothetical protein